MKNKRHYTGLIATFVATCGVYGQSAINTDTLQMLEGERLQEVHVMAHGHQHAKTRGLANTDFIGSGDLLRAACCNLGESFTTNPSVDVNYADAATGAQQIKLLGLSGTYVQMLTENIPNYRGAAAPYSLYPRSLDAEYPGIKRSLIGKERLRIDNRSD